MLNLKEMLAKKLFYSSFLRYMIVSNLKLTYTIFGFFIVTSYALQDRPATKDYVVFGGIIFGLLFLIVYPIGTMVFLFKN